MLRFMLFYGFMLFLQAMKKIISPIILIIGLLYTSTIHSQYINISETYTAQQLVENVFAKAGCAQVSNISIRGNGLTNESYGYFDNTGSTFSFQNGIVLTTGRAISSKGPNQVGTLSEGSNSWGGDSDLELALNINNTFNATVLEFDFVPYTSKISFDYIFASEQYLTNPSQRQCGFTDGFAFLLKEDGTTSYKNIALVPGTNIPVSVQTIRGSGTICPASNEAYFDQFNPFEYPIRYNGQTKILKAQSDVIIGKKYHVKLVIADQRNEQYDSAIFLGGGTFQSNTDLGPNRLIATNNPYCAGDTVTLDATQPGTNTYKWFKDGVEQIGQNNPTFIISDNTNSNTVKYSVEVTINGNCTSSGEILVQFAPLPTLTPQTLIQCDDNFDGISSFNLTTLDNSIKNNNNITGNISYFETLGGTVINNPQSYTSTTKTIYAEAANQFGCKNTTPVNLVVTSNPISNFQYSKCDSDTNIDGFTNFGLLSEIASQINPVPTSASMTFHKTIQEAIEQKNNLPNNYTNTTKDSETIFGRVANNNDCMAIYRILLNVNYIPITVIQDENKILCTGASTILSIEPNYVSTWSNGDVTSSTTVTTPGTYIVNITDQNGCTAQKKYIVTQSAPATNIEADIKEFSENNTVTVTYTDNGGDYEFSIDGVNFQNTPTFTNIDAGKYNIIIRDKNGCLPVTTKTIYVLDYPKFFTPNNDGYNDLWKIENIEFKNTITSIAIFNRYGKLLKYLTPLQSWDGIYLGNELPSDDYWFTINFIDGRTVKKHFTLKR